MLVFLIACGMDPMGGVPDDAVRGRICDPANSLGVVGAEVRSGDSATLTGPGGVFVLDGLADGDHLLSVEKGSFSTTIEVSVDGIGVDIDEACLDAGSVEVALIQGEIDDVGVVLDGLGIVYDVYDDTQLLRDKDALLQYDVLLLPAGIETSWKGNQRAVGKVVDDFLASGGSIYASGDSSEIVNTALSDEVEFLSLDSGETVRAEVLDADMRVHLGAAEATIEATAWTAMASTDGDVLVQSDGPVAVQHAFGEGQLIYTSFHHSAEMTDDMWMLLEEMILSL